MKLILLILSFVSLMVFSTPTVMYWKHMIEDKPFSGPVTLLVYSTFQFILLNTIVYILNFFLELSGKIDSIIPALAYAQVKAFSLLSLFVPLFSCMDKVMSTVRNHFCKHHKRQFPTVFEAQ